MNAREMYGAIKTGNRGDQERALLELCNLMQVAATAILELAGSEELRTGKYPLMDRSRLILGDFIELSKREYGNG